MATLLELRQIFNNSDLNEKVEVALVIAANDLITAPTPTEEQQKWAAYVFSNPRDEAKKAMLAVIAENNSNSISQILGASETAIKSQVAAVVSTLVVAYNAILSSGI